MIIVNFISQYGFLLILTTEHFKQFSRKKRLYSGSNKDEMWKAELLYLKKYSKTLVPRNTSIFIFHLYTSARSHINKHFVEFVPILIHWNVHSSTDEKHCLPQYSVFSRIYKILSFRDQIEYSKIQYSFICVIFL